MDEHSKPSICELDEKLKGLVEWEIFGVHLNGIEGQHIQSIKKDPGSNSLKKLALYHKWLSVYPNASWRHVLIALEKADESTLAKNVRSTLGGIVVEQEREKESGRIEVEVEETVISELKSLHLSFTKLFTNVRKHIEELVKSNKLSVYDIASAVEDAQICSIRGLTKVKTIQELFDILREQTMFLDGTVLEMFIELVVGNHDSQFLKNTKEHILKVRQFKEKHSIIALKHRLEQYSVEKSPSLTAITIRLHHPWEQVRVWLVEKFVRKLLQYNGEIHWQSITSGSVCLYLFTSKEAESAARIFCSEKVQLLRLTGVLSVQIGVVTVFSDGEKETYSFEAGLLKASEVGNSEAVQLLLYLDASTQHVGDDDAWTPSFTISNEGHYNFDELPVLLKKGVDEYITNSKDRISVLMLASRNGHHDTVQLLLAAGANPNVQDNKGHTAIWFACLKGHDGIVELLLNENADPNISAKNRWTPLMNACQGGHKNTVELLLQKEVDPNIVNCKTGKTPLMQASQNGHHDIVQLLLNAGANPNVQDNNHRTAIELASLNGHYVVTELLVKKNADPNIPTNTGWTPLMNASQEGHYKIVELLLDNGADPNVMNSRNGTTALIQASHNGHYDTVNLLLIAGANPNIQDKIGQTAIHLAALIGHHAVTKILLGNNANPSLRTDDGWVPIIAASQEGHYKIVELLLQSGVDPNTTNSKNGRTALMQASQNGHYDTVELLLTNGANPNIRDGDGCTAIELAYHRRHSAITKILINKKAISLI